MRDFPEYRDVPLAIGGRQDRRGVIATCNYPARKFGVRSAMATAHALRLCPQLHVIPGRMDEYKKVSAQIMALYRQVTDKIEPLSLDEAYLDVTDSSLYKGSATRIAEMLRQQVRETTGITISAGVAPNKFLAKIASDWNKPDGLFVVTPDQVSDFVKDLPVSKINGVGKRTTEKLQSLGIETCSDVQDHPESYLIEKFGQFGSRLYQLSRGIDDREVVTERIRKSISIEHTYPTDLTSISECIQQIPLLYEELMERFERLKETKRQHREGQIKGIFVKVKFTDFEQTTVEHQVTEQDMTLFEPLIREGYERHKKPVRLLGLGFRLDSDQGEHYRQLPLW